MERTKLYKKDSAGKVRVWWMEIDENRYRTCSGIEGGAVVESEWTECAGKNIGRANETSPIEQAVSEVASKYTKKIEQEHYVTSPDEVGQASRYFEPMLAKKYEGTRKKEVSAAEYVYTQSKLDGIRCLHDIVDGRSRKGKEFKTIGHVTQALRPFFERFPDVVLDGELYNHTYKDDFNELSSVIKSQKPTADDIAKAKGIVQYHIYDCFLRDNVTAGFKERMEFLARNLEGLGACIVVVPTHKAVNQEQLDHLYESYIDLGYEGQMIRFASSPYEFEKRSSYLLKRKEFEDAEFEIVAIEEGKGNRSGMAGRITYRTAEGKEFGSGIRGGFKFYSELWEKRHELIGKKATVRYQNLTPDGIPRFPVTTAIRDYE